MEVKLVTDLQYGSTGKGLLAGYLAETWKPEAVITANMPNAGHTYIDQARNMMVHKILPNGVVSPDCRAIFIGPGSAFWPTQLDKEVRQAQMYGYLNRGYETIFIHEHAMIMDKSYQALEESEYSRIASTMQGSAAAMKAKIDRDPQGCVTVGQHYYNEESTLEYFFEEMSINVQVLSPYTWNLWLERFPKILAEGSQGFSLGINQAFYPYCTSRECTPHRQMSEMGLPNIKAEVWGTLRTFPIRVGNTPDGFSGHTYPDQEELTWEELGQHAEKTTVTQRVRRVFTFSEAQLKDALYVCRPDRLFLNFCNYMDDHSLQRLDRTIRAVEHSPGVSLFGYGPTFHDVFPEVQKIELLG